MKRLLLDLDGVVCQYNFPKIVRSFFGVDISKNIIYAYDLADVLGVAPDMINNMFKEQVYGEPEFIDGALDILNEWHVGNSIVIFTNRIKYMGIQELIEWLTKHKIPFDSIDIKGTGVYDYHLDDSPAKLMTTESKIKLLYTQPWNKKCFNIQNALHRVNNWKEVKGIIHE